MAKEDIISTLPDAILCHILSFLETKQSVATSILSKRWKHLCLSVPVLHFKTTVTDQNEYIRFNDFVYSVLISRDPSLPIKTFYLDFTVDDYQILSPHCPFDTVTKWLKFVAQHGLQYLYLYVAIGHFPKFPLTNFSCSTLVVLNLKCFSLKEGISRIVLPSLKTLHLEDIYFNKLRDFMLLLNGCPILEDLFTFGIYYDSENSLTSDEWKSFSLTYLTKAEIDCFHFPLKAVQNVDFLRLRVDRLHCGDDSIPTFHNLTQLELIYLNYRWHFLLQVLKLSPKLQELKIDQAGLNKDFWTRNGDIENWVDPDIVPQCLSLHLRTFNLLNFIGLQGERQLAMYILKNAKVLQDMSISYWGKSKFYRLLSSSPMASPTCELTLYRCLQTTEKRRRRRQRQRQHAVSL